MNDLSEREELLIIDDDEINRGILENIFKKHYEILQAENGKAGLDILLERRDRICAVLLDYVMPEMNGLQVLQTVKGLGIEQQIPIFLITAEGTGQVVRDAYRLGVMDVISKPVVPFIVVRRVQSVVELFQARKQLRSTVEQQQSELLRQARQIIALNQGMIESLSAAIEFRDGESGEHVRRIHDITRFLLSHTAFGRGLKEEEIDNIALASVMHDVGKIAIPDAILKKPGRLTREEYEIMKTHTIQGAGLLERIPQIRESNAYHYAWDIARHHHERWDGRGYPDGLKGEEITPWAQVVSLADVYDALISKRVYKGALPPQQALDMIRSGECGTFNPLLLESFFQVEQEIREQIMGKEGTQG